MQNFPTLLPSSKAEGDNLQPASHIRPAKASLLALNWNIWLLARETILKKQMRPADENSCPLCSQLELKKPHKFTGTKAAKNVGEIDPCRPFSFELILLTFWRRGSIGWVVQSRGDQSKLEMNASFVNKQTCWVLHTWLCPN